MATGDLTSSTLEAESGPTPPVLELRELSKSFGPVQALHRVSLSLHRGEVLGLLGDNGAGKSTLVKCVSGVLKPDSGSILIDGEEAPIDAPQKARAHGIETVYQELALVDTLDVAANLFLNREIVVRPAPFRWFRWLSGGRMYREAEAILDRLQIRVPSVRQPIARLSGGQRQAVAVGRAVGWGRHLVMMDEPAAALGVQQAHHVLELVRTLRSQGVAVLFISHNMQQVVDICDRAMVLRHGRKVGDVSVRDVSPRDLVDLITGATETSGPISDPPDRGR